MQVDNERLYPVEASAELLKTLKQPKMAEINFV